MLSWRTIHLFLKKLVFRYDSCLLDNGELRRKYRVVHLKFQSCSLKPKIAGIREHECSNNIFQDFFQLLLELFLERFENLRFWQDFGSQISLRSLSLPTPTSRPKCITNPRQQSPKIAGTWKFRKYIFLLQKNEVDSFPELGERSKQG